MNFRFVGEMRQVYEEQLNWMSDLIKIRNELKADYSRYVEAEALEFNLSPGGLAVGNFHGPTKMGLVEFHLECEDSEELMNLIRIRIRPNAELKDRDVVANDSGSGLIYLVDENGNDEQEVPEDVNRLLSRVLEVLPRALFDQKFYRSWAPEVLPKSALLRVKYQRLNFDCIVDDFSSVHVEENLRQLLLRTPFPVFTPIFLESEIRVQAALIGLLHGVLASLMRLDSSGPSDEIQFESFELSSEPDFSLFEAEEGPQFEGLSIISVEAPTRFNVPIVKYGDAVEPHHYVWLYFGICGSLERGEVLRTLFGENRFAVDLTGPFQFDSLPSEYFAKNAGPLRVAVLKIPAKIFTADEAAGKYIEDNFMACLSQHFRTLNDLIYTSNAI